MPQVAANPDSPTGSLDALTIDGIDYSFDLRGHATSMGDQLSIASGGGADSIQAPSMGANVFSLGDVGASIRKVQQRIHIDVGATDHVYECLIVRATLGATTWTWEEILYRTPTAERVTVAAGPAAWAEFTIGDDVNLTTTGTSSGVATIVRRVDGGEGFLVAQHTGAAQWHNEFSRQADGTDIVSGWPFDMTWVGRAAFTGTPVPADGASVTDATDRPWRQIIDYEMLLPGEISTFHRGTHVEANASIPVGAPELDSIQIGAQVYTLPTLTPALPNAVGPLWGTVTFVAAARVTAETDVAAAGFTFTPTADTPTGVAKVGNTITLPRDITDDDVLGLWVIARNSATGIVVDMSWFTWRSTPRGFNWDQHELYMSNTLSLRARIELSGTEGVTYGDWWVRFRRLLGPVVGGEVIEIRPVLAGVSNNLLQQIGTGVGRQAILSSPLGIATSTRVNFPDAGINVTQVGHGLIDKDQIAQLFVSARSGSHNAVAGVFGREELDFVGWITEWTGWNTTLWAGNQQVPCFMFVGHDSDVFASEGWQLRPTFSKLRAYIISQTAPVLMVFPWESTDNTQARGLIMISYNDSGLALETAHYLFTD